MISIIAKQKIIMILPKFIDIIEVWNWKLHLKFQVDKILVQILFVRSNSFEAELKRPAADGLVFRIVERFQMHFLWKLIIPFQEFIDPYL